MRLWGGVGWRGGFSRDRHWPLTAAASGTMLGCAGGFRAIGTRLNGETGGTQRQARRDRTGGGWRAVAARSALAANCRGQWHHGGFECCGRFLRDLTRPHGETGGTTMGQGSIECVRESEV
jgi:hypothetical protein